MSYASSVLVFSLDQIKLVQVRFNDGRWIKANHEEGPLFTVPWMPELFATGVHYMQVRCLHKTLTFVLLFYMQRIFL